MRIKGEQGEEPGVMMAPLIDCVFLLLIFFLVASTLKQAHNEVAVRHADTAAAMNPSPDFDTFVIEVRGEGEYFLKGEAVGGRYLSVDPVNAKVVQQQLRELAAENPRRVIRIDGDRRTAFQHVVHLIDICKFEGLNSVMFRLGD
jgi:biopolymer transport protein ExbD